MNRLKIKEFLATNGMTLPVCAFAVTFSLLVPGYAGDGRAQARKPAVDARAPEGARPAPRPRPRPRVRAKPIVTPMVRVPAGCFLMGSAARDAYRDERPVHRVCLSGYLIDKTEVTVEAYRRCVSAGRCTGCG